MEIASINPHTNLKPTKFIRIKMGQDGLFYGREFAKEFFKDSSIKINWFADEGDCLLKDQSFATIQTSPADQQKVQDFSKVCAYFSGIATLVCCYVENAQDTGIKVIGSEAKNSSFNPWELKIIQSAKGFTRPSLPLWMVSSPEQLSTLLKQNPKRIAFNKNLLPPSSLNSLLEQVPSGIEKGIYGHLLPRDLAEFPRGWVDLCWPELLQGHFPSIKINLHAEP